MILKKLRFNLSQSKTLKRVLLYLIVLFLGGYVFCIPSFGEREGILRYTIYASMAFLSICSLLYCFVFGDFRLNKYCLLIPLFAAFAIIGTIAFSHDYRSWITLLLLTISFFTFIYSFKAIDNKLIIINAIAIALFAFSAYYIFKYRNEILNFKSFGDKGFRIVTIFDNQNGVAAYSIVGLSLSFYEVFFGKRKIRFLHLVPILSFSVVGITTGSRTFFILYFILVLIFLYFKFKKHKLIFFILVGLLFIIGLIVINLPFLATLKTRLLSAIGTLFGTDTKVDHAAMERAIWMDYAFYLGEKNLLIGYGCNGFPVISGVGTYSHSNFSEALCNFGLIGFILFYLPLFICLFKSFGLKNNEKVFVTAFFIYYFIASFTNVIYYKKVYFLILAFMFFLCFFSEKSSKQTKLLTKCEKIVFTCDTMGCGGAERVISILSNGLTKKGIDVSIVGVGDTKEPNSFYCLEENVKYISLGYDTTSKKLSPLFKLIRLTKVLKEEKPDIVISFLPVANIYTCFALSGTGIPYVVSERNDPKIDPKSKLIRFLKKYSFYQSDGVVFQTRGALSYYSSKVQKKSTIIQNPLRDDLCFEYSPTRNKKKTIIAVGRLTPQKNHKMLLDAFEILYETYSKEYKLHIYGEGELEDYLRNYSDSLKSKNNVMFMGNDDEWQKMEQDASLYVLSSNYEGMPNSLIESVACGITSISTDCPCGGPKSILESQYLVPVDDFVSLSQKMIDVLKNNYHLSKETVEFYRAQYSSENVVNKWLTYLGNLK